MNSIPVYQLSLKDFLNHLIEEIPLKDPSIKKELYAELDKKIATLTKQAIATHAQPYEWKEIEIGFPELSDEEQMVKLIEISPTIQSALYSELQQFYLDTINRLKK